MKIAKLYKPQRMGSWENVLAYSSEEENPDELADAEAAANADSTSTDSTGVQRTDRGLTLTSQDSTGRITFTLNSPIWIADGEGPDSTDVDSLKISVTGAFGSGIEMAIPLPVDSEVGTVLPPAGYIVPGAVEYDTLGRRVIH